MNKRFESLSKAVKELVVDDDAFGLKKKEPFTILQQVPKQVWRFHTDTNKVKAYRRWLQNQVDAKILTPVGGISGKPWTAPYIESAYRKGAVRAYTDLHSAELAGQMDYYLGGKEQFLRDAFASPEMAGKVELLYTRAFDELKGVTDVMGQQMSRILAGGLAEGISPTVLARRLRNSIGTLTRTRARAIARTEIVRAHSEGQLDSFEKLGVKEVGLMAEWSTAGDELVCELCGELEGVVMKIKEARGLLPRHVNCRCAWIPADPKIKEKGQLYGKRKDAAVAKSIRAEGGVDEEGKFKKSLEETKRKSTWTGKERLKAKARAKAARRVRK
jgi:SPP1 gp7 family putative phage head morphogenesis protein